ncbi:MAG: MATE family efflux transporter [Fretibacterium sp.]|nr:MATE family efflux transporter [Fretibacterium sp.]
MDSLERMEREPIIKLIISFSLPGVAGTLANSLYNIVDRIFVGKIVGTEGLAAISVCFPIMLLGVSLCLLIGLGSAPLIAIALGEEDRERAERVLGQACGALLLLGGLIFLVGRANLDFVLRLSGAGPAVLPMAREYLRIVLLGFPISLLGFGLNFCLRAEGRPGFAMGTQVLGALVNILLDALFIYKLKMGVIGAAWGTVLAQAVSAAWVFSFYLLRRGILRIRLRAITPDMRLLRRIGALGLSSCLAELSFTLLIVLFNQTLRRYGGDLAVSAIGIFTGWDSLLFLPAIGIGDAVQTLFGYNWGAGRPERVLDSLKWALALTSGYFALSSLGVRLFIDPMMRCFTSDPELLSLAAEGMLISYSAVVFSGIALVTSNFFQGLGKARLSLFLTLHRQFLLLIPPILILPPLLGVRGVWFCFPVVDLGGGVLALFMLVRYCKKLGLLSYNNGVLEGHRSSEVFEG